MGKPSRDKGARGERELEAIFRAHGLPLLHLMHTGDRYLPLELPSGRGLLIDSKRRERLDLGTWMIQAWNDAERDGIGLRPVVAFRCNQRGEWHPFHRWHATLPLDTLCEVIARGSA